jgi:fructokinase
MTRFVASMGEALIDFLPISEGGRTVGFHIHSAGAPLNVAVGVSRLGQPSAFIGKISHDFFGRMLRGYIAQEGIDGRFLRESDAATTLAIVADEGGEPAFSFYGDGAADTLLTPQELPGDLPEHLAMLHVGSISLLRGSTPSAVLAAVERCRGRALISFDPNIRPGLVRDAGAYRALIDRVAGMADLLKISAADLGWLSPELSVEQAAERFLKLGPALVVVTQGGKGGLALHRGRQQRIPVFPIRVADTVGAGDTFNAGLLAGLAEHGVRSRQALEAIGDEALSETLRFAAAAAAINCSRPGCNPPTRAEVAAFLGESKI